MRENDPQGLLAAAQSRVAGARILLSRPRACDPNECVALFREAQGYLEWLRDSFAGAAPANPDLRRRAANLALDVRQAGILAEHAARHGRRWLERFGSMPPEYTAGGGAVPLHLRGRISYLG
ncbi:MAG TPA: hypothetical protein VN924_12495 [Bryobacteraceae bacterium]|jgi:hypothetical protein|nr:hypothetical protein [Bryobacteraceae bacterium]